MERRYIRALHKHRAVCPLLLILLRKVPTCEHLFLVQIFDFWDIFWATIYEKSLTERSVRDFCGEDEIRTRGTLETYVGLANRWFQPLTHLSRGTRGKKITPRRDTCCRGGGRRASPLRRCRCRRGWLSLGWRWRRESWGWRRRRR